MNNYIYICLFYILILLIYKIYILSKNIQSNLKKKESSWIDMFKNFSLNGWDNSKSKIVVDSSCKVCDSPSKVIY